MEQVLIISLTALNLAGLTGFGFYAHRMFKDIVNIQVSTFEKNTKQLAEIKAQGEKVKQEVEELKRRTK